MNIVVRIRFDADNNGLYVGEVYNESLDVAREFIASLDKSEVEQEAAEWARVLAVPVIR